MSHSEDPMSRPLTAAFDSGADCPPLELVVRLATDELEPKEALTIRSHALGCPRCQAELELAHTLLCEEEETRLEGPSQGSQWEDAGAPFPANPARSTRKSPAAPQAELTRGLLRLAAAAVLLVGVGWGANELLSPSNLPPLDPTSATRSALITVISPLGAVSPDFEHFEWDPVEGAAVYQLWVERVDRTIVFETSTRSNRYPIDSSESNQLSANIRYNWVVKALDQDGRELARSSTRFSIEPSS